MKSTYTSTVERGILTSVYKKEIRERISESKKKSISQIKSKIFKQPNLESQTGTLLRVSFFMLAVVFMIS